MEGVGREGEESKEWEDRGGEQRGNYSSCQII